MAVPTCGKCGKRHYNFAACDVAKIHQPVDVRYRHTPDGFHTSTRWGVNTTRPVIYQLPVRHRTGSLTGPDGAPYTPEPMPPEAA